MMAEVQKDNKTILSNISDLFSGVWSGMLVVTSRDAKLAILILNYHNLKNAIGWGKISVILNTVMLMLAVHILIEIPIRQKLEVHTLKQFYPNDKGNRYEKLNSTAKLNIDRIAKDGYLNSRLNLPNMIVNIKRDMWILIFGTLTFPVLPTIYMIMYTIPLQRRMYPKDTEVDLSYRASFPYKQGNKSYSRGLLYLTSQIGIGMLMYKIGIYTFNNSIITLDIRIVWTITLMALLTALQAIIYVKFLTSTITDMLTNTPTEKAVIENRNKPKTQTPLVREFKRTATRMKDGFK